MDPLVAKNRQVLENLCAQYKVRRLELFGSAAASDGDTASNDLDFLIEFEDIPPRDYSEAYFGLLDALTALFDKPVDLVAISSVSNPYFLRSIERTRTLLYAA